jgi:WD40 repeat protein
VKSADCTGNVSKPNFLQVVTVWELGKKQFTIRQHLYGHTDAVTCMDASAGYQILVSGSRDRTAIVWDLSRLSFIRQLTGHNAPLAAVAINELTVSSTFHEVYSTIPFLCAIKFGFYVNLFTRREILPPVPELGFICGPSTANRWPRLIP